MRKLLTNLARIGVSAVLALNITGFVPMFTQGARASSDDDEVETGTLIIKKKVVSANAQADDGKFNLLVNNVVKASDVGDNGTTGSLTVAKGSTYTVSETAGTATNLTNYTTEIKCVDYEGKDIASSSTTSVSNVEVKKGKTTTCTITNTRKKGSVKVVKDVVNDNGGTKTAANFTFTNNGGVAQGFTITVTPDGEKLLTNLPVGSAYDIKEVEENANGYATTYSAQCSGAITTATKTCTIKNDDVAPTLTLVKTVINDNGGEKTQKDFQAQLDGFDTPWGTQTTTIGDHTVSEPLYNDYTQSVWGGDCAPNGSITLALGDNKTCTITNDDIAPKLTLVKVLEDSYSSLYEKTDWTLKAEGPTSISGAGEVSSDEYFDAGTYTLSEEGPTAGIKSGNWSCDNAKVSYGAISIMLGQSVTCTITNTVLPAKLTVNKVVINDNSGESVASDFSFSLSEYSSFGFEDDDYPTVKGAHSTGSRTIELSRGTYTVVEDQENNGEYTTTYSGDCFEVEINNGEEKTCTITNNDVSHPSFYVEKAKEGPDWAYEGDSLLYTFSVVNTGDADLTITEITDSITGAGTYLSGDMNSDGVLNTYETWVYYGEYTVPEGQIQNVTNTVTVCAEEYTGWTQEDVTKINEESCATDEEGCLENTLCDTDTHSTDILHPSINVVKSGPASATAGANVTYTFTVTNTGDVSLSTITVVDSITGDAVYVSGDENENSQLDLEETWVFTASYTIPANQTAPVVNTVEACGMSGVFVEVNDRALRAFAEGNAEQEVEGVQACDEDSHTLAIAQVLGASTTATPTQSSLVNTGNSMMTLFSLIALFNVLAALTIVKKQFVSADNE